MPGYMTLGKDDFHILLNQADKETVIVPSSAKMPYPFNYEINQNVVIIHSPIPSYGLQNVLSHLKEITKDKHILLSVVGQGLNEQHIATMHILPVGNAVIYDSKSSDPEFFFDPPRSPNRFAIILKRIGKSLFSGRDGIPLRLKALTDVDLANLGDGPFYQDGDPNVCYKTLGTQSFFDGVSCGYHCASNINCLTRMINTGREVTLENLLNENIAPVTTSARILAESATDSANKVNNSFKAFMKQAWLDTFMPYADEEKRQEIGFYNYFLGWPEQNNEKSLFILTLGFITHPAINTLKLLIEFPFNALGELAAYTKNRLINWSPTNRIIQTFKSGLLALAVASQYTFKGLYHIAKMTTAPINSAREAWAISPLLGLTSALISAAVVGTGLATITLLYSPFWLLLGVGAVAYSLSQKSMPTGNQTQSAIVVAAARKDIDEKDFGEMSTDSPKAVETQALAQTVSLFGKRSPSNPEPTPPVKTNIPNQS